MDEQAHTGESADPRRQMRQSGTEGGKVAEGRFDLSPNVFEMLAVGSAQRRVGFERGDPRAAIARPSGGPIVQHRPEVDANDEVGAVGVVGCVPGRPPHVADRPHDPSPKFVFHAVGPLC